MQELLSKKKKVAFTKKQIEDIEKFKAELAQGNISFAFEGSLLEGITFLKGATDIVQAFNH